MKRRDFLTALFGVGCAAVANPTQAQTVRRRKLGYLSGGNQGMGEYTIDIDERWADGDASRLASLAKRAGSTSPGRDCLRRY